MLDKNSEMLHGAIVTKIIFMVFLPEPSLSAVCPLDTMLLSHLGRRKTLQELSKLMFEHNFKNSKHG